MDDRIIQIMPAPDNMYVLYEDDGEEFEVKVICLGLTKIGNIILLESDDTGFIDECRGFERIVYK